LLAVYGLRSSEVVALNLESVDWQKEIITVIRAKTRRQQVFPLTKEVGEALVLHLNRVFPNLEV
jgi:integrase/recombinase XerD